MNRRTLILAGTLTVTGIAGTACQPPTPPKPLCGPYTLAHEGKPLGCLPAIKGTRVDFIMAGPVTPSSPANVRNAAVARCGAVPLVGAPYWLELTPGNLASRVLACRTAVV